MSTPTFPFPPFPTQSQAGPVLIVAVPGFGPAAGGNLVLLVGLGLSGVTSVTFGGVPATIVSQDPAGLTLLVLAPPHVAGSVPVLATGPSGTSNAANYTYVGTVVPPTATAITPATGPVAGGTPFTITGTNLTGATVLFGALPATGVTVNPAGTSLTGITPAGAAGNVPVTVVTPTGSTVVPGGFTYGAGAAPTVTALVPATGPVTGGTPIVITGTNLTGATVTVGGVAATGVTVNAGGTVLFAVTPAGTAGNQPVVVTTPAGSVTVPGGFTYGAAAAPTVTALVPATGPVLGGTPIVITGTNLTGATVTVGGVAATGVTVNAGGTVLTAVTPAGVLGNQPVVVTTPAGSVTVPGGFTYAAAAAPTVSVVVPATGPVLGGTAIVITGTNLIGATVTVGGVLATGITVDPTGTVLFAVTPAGLLGNQAVVVTTAGGSATVPGGFIYV